LNTLNFFQKDEDRLKLGVEGVYPDHLVEQGKAKPDTRKAVNETLTRPWIKHYFIMQLLRDNLTLWTSDMQDSGQCRLMFVILNRA